MQTTTTLPNGQTRTITAYTPAEIQTVLQQLTLQVLGITLPASSATPAEISAIYSQIRIGWQMQPTWAQTEDVCFLTATLTDLPNLKVRDAYVSADGSAASQTYQRAWEINWTIYGPNSANRAAIIHAALLDDYAQSILLAAGLYIRTTFDLPYRLPEQYNTLWYERSTLKAALIERVTSTVNSQPVTSVPVSVTYETSIYNGYGDGGYGAAPYGAERSDGTITTTSTAQ